MNLPDDDLPWTHPIAASIKNIEYMQQQATRRASWMAGLMVLSLSVAVRELNRAHLIALFAILTAVLFGIWAVLFLKIRSAYTPMLTDLEQLRRQFGDAPRWGVERSPEPSERGPAVWNRMV